MDFSRDRDQQELYDRIAGAWNGRPATVAGGDSGAFRDAWELCGQLGLLGLSVPIAYGGGGASCTATGYALEAFGYGRADSGLVFSACAHLPAAGMPVAGVR